jgi:hypothetical protein
MGRFYRNEYLFSEVYFKKITKINENPCFLTALSALQHYRETADSTSLQAWNDSFVYEVLRALKFGMHKVDEHLMLLYQPGIPDQIISLCYVGLPSEELDNTTMGRNWAEKLIRYLRQRELKWGILTNGDYWRIYYGLTEEEIQTLFHSMQSSHVSKFKTSSE